MTVPRAWAAALRVAASLTLFGAAAASGQTPAAAGGAAAATAPARAAQCGACHGVDGHSTLALGPSLAGQPRVFLENTLIMIREDLRPIAAMKGQIDGVGDAEIVALADHYSRLPTRAEAGPRDEAALRRGEALASRNLCGTCHLPSYAGQPQMPRLAGQRQDYLAHCFAQLR
ncbi:MAG: cytochrome c4 [Burkholderiaceae bacterium]|jgi:cytochrome c553|nr:cytochrome c4 [Burkholderiaceae bacterium]MCZ8174639.1 cytochrome c4 [Burkholderiaceae bacterium]